MVQPVALRAAKVFDFLQSVRPEIKLELFTLSDELGPSAYDPKLQVRKIERVFAHIPSESKRVYDWLEPRRACTTRVPPNDVQT